MRKAAASALSLLRLLLLDPEEAAADFEDAAGAPEADAEFDLEDELVLLLLPLSALPSEEDLATFTIVTDSDLLASALAVKNTDQHNIEKAQTCQKTLETSSCIPFQLAKCASILWTNAKTTCQSVDLLYNQNFINFSPVFFGCHIILLFLIISCSGLEVFE